MSWVEISLLTMLILLVETPLTITSQVTKAKEGPTLTWKTSMRGFQREISTPTKNKLGYVLKLW